MGSAFGNERIIFRIRKYHANPNHPHAERELALFATHFKGDHERIALYAPQAGEGYLLCVEQLENTSLLHLYPRFGRQTEPLRVVALGADSTDGLDACACDLGAPFASGIVVAMNTKGATSSTSLGRVLFADSEQCA